MADFGGYHHHSTYTAQVDTNIFNWLSVCGMTLMIGALLWINIILAPQIKTYLTEHKDNGRKSVVLSAMNILCLSCSAICSCSSSLIVLIYSDFNHQLILVDALTKASLCIYCGCQTLMIYVFTKRLSYVFTNTTIGYSQSVVNALYISNLIFLLFYIFFMTSYVCEFYSVYYVTAVIWIAIYSCLSLTLCLLFVRKVEILMVHATSIDKDLLYIILKSIILVPTSIGSSFIFFMVMTFIVVVFSPGKWNPIGIFWNVLDCTVSSVCLFLLFASNNKYYDKYCHCIHAFCEKKKVSGLEKKIVSRQCSNRSIPKGEKTDLETSHPVSVCTNTLERVTSDSVGVDENGKQQNMNTADKTDLDENI